MTKKRTQERRLELDLELIADLESDGDDVMGGQYSYGGSASVVKTVGCPTRGIVQGGDGLNAGC